MGNNHLGQIIYNPSSGGCYDGLEENQVNLNQGAESVVSYLMARLTLEMQSRVGAGTVKIPDNLKHAPILYDVINKQNASYCTSN